MKRKKPPKPGSRKAIQLGCICPVLDNAHGKGYHGMKNTFVYIEGCKIHKWEDMGNETKITRRNKTTKKSI